MPPPGKNRQLFRVPGIGLKAEKIISKYYSYNKQQNFKKSTNFKELILNSVHQNANPCHVA